MRKRSSFSLSACSVLLVLVLVSFSCFVTAEHASWDCPGCGRTGNTGNFCGGCGTPAPWMTAADEKTQEPAALRADGWKVALITDYGSINDQSYNQAAYEACLSFCGKMGMDFRCWKPAADSDSDRIFCIEAAVQEGFNILVLPGYVFAPAIASTADKYPQVLFIALDISESDLQYAYGTGDGSRVYPPNLYCVVYREELLGFMAGYAAVMMDYSKLGYLGGMELPEVVRCGYGFVQGADAAATRRGLSGIEIRYVYGNQFYGDEDITEYMNNWYSGGTEVIFVCGGGIYISAGEAAAKTGGKIIGMDMDQAPLIDYLFGEGVTVTSAVKSYSVTLDATLTSILNGTFQGGIIDNLGLAGENPDANFVQLAPSTRFTDSFTTEDYREMTSMMFSGEFTVSDSTDHRPSVSTVTVHYEGSIK